MSSSAASPQSSSPRTARVGTSRAQSDTVLEECEPDGGEARSFEVGDVLEGQAVLFVPGTPLFQAGEGVLGTAEPGRAPVDGVLGQQVDDVVGGRVQSAREAGDGEVSAGHGPMELGDGDAVRVGPGECEVA